MVQHEIISKVINEYFGKGAAEIVLIKDKLPQRIIWQIRVDGTKYILKAIRTRKRPIPLLVYVQHHLWNSGIKVPAVVPTKTGELYIEKDNYYFYISEFIESVGKPTLEQRTEVLTKLHQVNIDSSVVPLQLSMEHIRTRHDFLQYYYENIDLIKKWQSHHPYFKPLKHCIKSAERSVRQLEQYDLDGYLNSIWEQRLVYHGDFNVSNILTTESGDCYLIDFDRAGIGPQTIDVHMFHTKLFRSKIEGLEEAILTFYPQYISNSPSAKQHEELFLIDALFPHRACKVFDLFDRVKANPWGKPKEFSAAISELHYKHFTIEHLIDWELTKEKCIKKLL